MNALVARLTKSRVLLILQKAFSQFVDDKATTFAASLSYYTVFSIAPTLVIVLAVAGSFYAPEVVSGQLKAQLNQLVGPNGAEAIDAMMQSAVQKDAGFFPTIIGFIALLFGATGTFAELQAALNVIWRAKPRVTNGLLAFVRTRFLSFTIVLGIAFLLLVSLVISAALSALGSLTAEAWPGWQVVNFVVAFTVVTVLFAMILKLLPDTPVEWRDVWFGAAITAALFNIGKLLIGLYIGKSAIASSYGAAGSLAVLLVWVYYSANILLLGAELTHAFSTVVGSKRGISQHTEVVPSQATSQAIPNVDKPLMSS